MREISQIRKDYKNFSLNEDSVEINPFKQFEIWWQQVEKAGIEEPNAMMLATVDNQTAAARIVLLKGFNEKGFVFFTNYNSAKSKQLQENKNMCLLFFWKELERQVRITGVAQKISIKESITYFNSRPEGSKIGAWASPQSTIVAGKAWLENTFDYYKERFSRGEIPKPPHWGGYRVKPISFEFWQGRPNRMHDRIYYDRYKSEWKIKRLAP